MTAPRIFLISFGQAPERESTVEEEDDQPFEPFSNHPVNRRLVKVRMGQPQFKFDVIKRYGSRCAVCAIDFVELA